jgi:hypothetical protein
MKLVMSLSALALTGYLVTSTSPVHAAPARSPGILASSGHELRPDLFDSSVTNVQLLASVAVGALFCAVGGPQAAVAGGAGAGAAYLASHLDITSHYAVAARLPANVDARHIAQLSETRLDAPSSRASQ